MNHTIFTVGPPYSGGMMQNGLSVKDASLAARPLLPSALHKIMVGLNPRELVWLWSFMGYPVQRTETSCG